MPAWLMFLISAAAVAGAGVRLARDGDDIAEGTGLGGMWVGAILVAATTSLPELLTDVNAVLQGNPSLAVGDLFGSCMANMLILAIADLFVLRTRILARVAINQMLIGTLGIFLTVVATLGVLFGAGTQSVPLGVSTAVIGFAYVAGMRLMHRNREEPVFQSATEEKKERSAPPELRRAFLGFAASALVIVIASPFLASSAADLADALGISRGFAGMLFLAITTSLPEAAVSYGAIRAGSYDLAVGNLLGSNCFNMAALVPLDIVQGAGPMLALVEPGLAVGGLFAVLLTALAMLDVMNKAERRIWILEPGPAFMILTYLVGIYATYNAPVP